MKATPPASLVLTQASAVASATCYDDDFCVAELFIQLNPGPKFVFYSKSVEKVPFISAIQRARLAIAISTYHLSGVIDQADAIESDLLGRINEIFDAVEKRYDSFDDVIENATDSLKNIISDLADPVTDLAASLDVISLIQEYLTQFSEQQT